MTYLSDMIIHDIFIEEPEPIKVDMSKVKTINQVEKKRSKFTDPVIVFKVNKNLYHHRVTFLYYPTGSEKPISFSTDCCNPEAISLKEFIGLTFSFGYDKICELNSVANCPVCCQFLGKKFNEKKCTN